MNTQQEQELSTMLNAMVSAGLLERRIGENGKEEFRKTEKLQEVPPSPPITEDSFYFNTKCVCSKEGENDYPCMCDIHEEEEDIACGDCDYTISQGEFDSGKGRIMFNDVNEEGTEYRCGCCDDRVADPMGMFPDDDEE